MKSKHYPLLTAALAIALVLVPCILLVIILNSGDDTETNSVIDQALSSPAPATSATYKPTEKPALEVEPPITQIASAGGPVSQLTEPAPVVRVPKPPEVPSQSGEVPSVGSDLQRAFASDAQQVPVPVDVTMADSILPEAEEGDEAADSDPELIEIPRRAAVADSYYDATGHLAMVGQGQTSDPLANAPVAVSKESGEPVSKDSASTEATSANDSKSKETKRGNSRRRGKKDGEAMTETQGDHSSATTSPTEANPFLRGPAAQTKNGEDVDPALMEDVVINTPTPNSQVNRVEDVVATTVAKGWPIALIRSDLPDDVWWVQQVIGIQGNSFGARVNFGNEYTVRGSAYRMVIVFLDSPDEVRRFRIAKQFKEIPEGARRSREFHYIRK